MAKIIGGIATSHTPTIGFALGTNYLHIYAAMRGQSLADFQQTRNAQVLYSLAGRDEGKKDWAKK